MTSYKNMSFAKSRSTEEESGHKNSLLKIRN